MMSEWGVHIFVWNLFGIHSDKPRSNSWSKKCQTNTHGVDSWPGVSLNQECTGKIFWAYGKLSTFSVIGSDQLSF